MNDFRRQVASMRAEIDEAVARVLSSGWFILGEEVAAFERAFAAFVGVAHAVGVGNGMDAIQLGLMAHDIGPGDEVITTPNSAFATALAVVRTGARPVFVDIDPDSYTLDARQVEAAITPRTRALLPVHLYGQAAELDALEEIATRHRLVLIGDAAQAHGARFANRDVATFGRATAYSFYPTKNLGAFGDGGAVVTNDAQLAARLRTLRDYGQTHRYHHTENGLNSRLDELHAAILRVKLQHLPAHNARRRAIAARYHAQLSGLPLALPREKPYGQSVWHLFVIRTPRRDMLSAFLKARGIATLVHYPVILPHQAALKPLDVRGGWPVAERSAAEFLSLPIFPELLDEEVDRVAAGVREFFAA
jgi:dTDP-4-amino-4,6-dideoxygalactose transaminase